MRRRDHDRIISELKRGYDREIQGYKEMLDRAMYMMGQPWTPPPPVPDLVDEDAPEPYMFAPEQAFDAAGELQT